jgi:hypothetical protein
MGKDRNALIFLPNLSNGIASSTLPLPKRTEIQLPNTVRHCVGEGGRAWPVPDVSPLPKGTTEGDQQVSMRDNGSSTAPIAAAQNPWAFPNPGACDGTIPNSSMWRAALLSRSTRLSFSRSLRQRRNPPIQTLCGQISASPDAFLTYEPANRSALSK